MLPIKQTIVTHDGRRLELTRQGVDFAPGESPTGMDPKTWKALLTRAWRIAGQFWHKVILPKHFTHAGASEYHYQERKPKYEKKKLRKFGHTYPLIFSGELKRDVQRIQDVRADAKGARVVLHGPKHLWAYRKGWQPDKAAELQALSEGDAQAVAKVLDDFMGQELRRGPAAVGQGHQGQGPDIFGGHKVAG